MVQILAVDGRKYVAKEDIQLGVVERGTKGRAKKR
jgi:hypothetical protein